MIRPTLASLAVLALLPAGGLAQTAKAPAEFAVARQTIEDRKAVYATVESADETVARARIGGTVADLSVVEGADVTAGQRVAAVGDPKMHLQLLAADQRLQSLQAQRDLAEIELDRARELRRSGAGTQARVDDAATQLQVAERAQAAARSDRQVLVERLAEGAVLAPMAGRVLKVHVTDGTVVMPGETVATIAVERYVLRAHLPERHARFINVGDSVLVGEGKLAGGQDQRQGKVTLVYPRVSDGRVVADIEVEGLGDYFVGERVRVYVSAGARETYVVPEDFLFRRSGLTYARLKEGAEVIVQPGRAVAGGIEILSGLRDGDVLVRP